MDIVVIDALSRTPYSEIGKTFTSATQRVRSAPQLPTRALIGLPAPRHTVASGKFSVLTYNLLADLYTNVSLSQPPTAHLTTALILQDCLALLNEQGCPSKGSLSSISNPIAIADYISSKHFTGQRLAPKASHSKCMLPTAIPRGKALYRGYWTCMFCRLYSSCAGGHVHFALRGC